MKVICPGSYNQVRSGELNPDSLMPEPDKLSHHVRVISHAARKFRGVGITEYKVNAASGQR